jgi:hypothetical protein
MAAHSITRGQLLKPACSSWACQHLLDIHLHSRLSPAYGVTECALCFPETHAAPLGACLLLQLFYATFTIKDADEKIKARQEVVAGPLKEKMGHLSKLLVSPVLPLLPLGSTAEHNHTMAVADIEQLHSTKTGR